MTVIAWRFGIMACDSCWATDGVHNVTMNKILRLSSGALLGSAGENDARAMYALLDKVKTEKQLPTAVELASTKLDYAGLLALPKGGVWHVVTGKHDTHGYPHDDQMDFGCFPADTIGGYAACGSGGDFALGAMAGSEAVTAKLAVAAAIRHQVNCRGPIYYSTLTPKVRK